MESRGRTPDPQPAGRRPAGDSTCRAFLSCQPVQLCQERHRASPTAICLDESVTTRHVFVGSPGSATIPYAVWPQLLLTTNGVLLLASGRPGIGFWVSPSGDGSGDWVGASCFIPAGITSRAGSSVADNKPRCVCQATTCRRSTAKTSPPTRGVTAALRATLGSRRWSRAWCCSPMTRLRDRGAPARSRKSIRCGSRSDLDPHRMYLLDLDRSVLEGLH